MILMLMQLHTINYNTLVFNLFNAKYLLGVRMLWFGGTLLLVDNIIVLDVEF